MSLLSVAAEAILVVTASFGDEKPPGTAWVVAEGPEGFHARAEVAASAPARLSVPLGTSLVYRCEAPGFWGESRAVVVEAGEVKVTCQLWREAELTGEFRYQGRPVVVEALRYRLLPEPGGHVLETEGNCVLGELGRFRCHLPAGKRSVALKAPGYAALYLWGVLLEPGTRREMGPLELVRGSSVAGWVIRAFDKGPGARARVTLNLQGEHKNDKMSHQEFVVKADDRGFFQFTGLSPGAYVLRAELADGASPPVVVSTTEGMETVLRAPLTVYARKSVSVVVSPPQDLNDNPWRVELWDQDFARGSFSLVARQVAGPQGECVFSQVLPQEYVLRVKSVDGQSFFHKRVDLSQEDVVFVALEMLPVRGVVRLGDEPVKATLYFGGKSGAEKIVAASNQEGLFSCVLPRPGRWVVQVEAPELHLSRFQELEIARPRRRGDCRVEIALPATRLSGQVVDTEGRAVKALVNVSGSVETVSQVFTGEDGKFLFRGLGPGWLWIQAETPSASSKRHGVVLTEGMEHQLVLVVEPRVSLAGHVRFASAAVAGAALYFHRSNQPGIVSEEARTQTALDGSFEVSLPPGRYAVVVEAPGFCRELFPTSVASQNPPLSLNLRQDCGTLVLGLPNQGKGEELVVGVGGFWEWVSTYEDWARRHGVEFEPTSGKVPGLASATYHFCRVAQGPEGFAFRECRQGFLPPGGELRLALPSSPER